MIFYSWHGVKIIMLQYFIYYLKTLNNDTFENVDRVPETCQPGLNPDLTDLFLFVLSVPEIDSGELDPKSVMFRQLLYDGSHSLTPAFRHTIIEDNRNVLKSTDTDSVIVNVIM